ncbi:MAG: GNAT family N-acetyltransferase [Flavobacteriaceae bacterium]|nr:GNAT family N-acetyltransferase [Flavobacteriaceae bacterium]
MNGLTENLNSNHRKKEFSCGKEMLDNYLQKQANQDIKRKLSACFVLNDKETNLLKGYYTLANNNIPQNLIPTEFQKKLPKSYTSIPTTLLGRLAIDNRFQGKGIGKLLLMDALNRSYEISKSIGSFAVIVDPLDEDAENFYDKYGFINLPDSGKMFLPMNTIKTLFE